MTAPLASSKTTAAGAVQLVADMQDHKDTWLQCTVGVVHLTVCCVPVRRPAAEHSKFLLRTCAQPQCCCHTRRNAVRHCRARQDRVAHATLVQCFYVRMTHRCALAGTIVPANVAFATATGAIAAIIVAIPVAATIMRLTAVCTARRGIS